MSQSHMAQRPVLGVLGGMGPLASAAFVDTVYRLGAGHVEQRLPAVILYSNPGVPDRSRVLGGDGEDDLIRAFADGLRTLADAGATRIVVCCFTIHYLLDRMPARLRARVLSLVDALIDGVLARGQPHLMLCTAGSQRLSILERHPRWSEVAGLISYPNADDQAALHEAIYQVKQHHRIDALRDLVEALDRRYGDRPMIVGCTELHLLTRGAIEQAARPGGQWTAEKWLDPLVHLARAWLTAHLPTDVAPESAFAS